jgi:transposase
MLLRHYLEQSSSKSALARELGVSRDTIHRWIRDGDLNRDLDTASVCYGPRAPMPTKLDAFKPIIETRLAAYPELSAVRLLDGVRAAGYDGGYTQLKAFVRRVRPTPPPESIIRFETPAGRQAQVDFARFRFAWGIRCALLVVLGYSRLLWCRFYPRQDMATLIDGLEDAFLYFGGVPQELLFDQMKAVITRDLRSSTRPERRMYSVWSTRPSSSTGWPASNRTTSHVPTIRRTCSGSRSRNIGSSRRARSI